MPTLGAMVSRIQDEIARSDIETQVRQAITSAITIYQGSRFRFSESRATTFQTAVGQDTYTASANPIISNLFGIDYLTVLIGNTEFDVQRVAPEYIENLSFSSNTGQPYTYSYYNEAIRLYPYPNAAYQMRIAGHLMINAPVSDGEPYNRWMTDGERLIRSRAKYELATHVTKDDAEAQRMSPVNGAAYDAWRELTSDYAGLVEIGRIAPSQF